MVRTRQIARSSDHKLIFTSNTVQSEQIGSYIAPNGQVRQIKHNKSCEHKISAYCSECGDPICWSCGFRCLAYYCFAAYCHKHKHLQFLETCPHETGKFVKEKMEKRKEEDTIVPQETKKTKIEIE